MCDPQNSPQLQLWPFAIKRLESHALHINGRKDNWVGHTFGWNGLLKHVTEVTGIRQRRRK